MSVHLMDGFSGTDDRFLSSACGPAEFHEKLRWVAEWEGGDGEVGMTVEKSRPFVCLIRSMHALSE